MTVVNSKKLYKWSIFLAFVFILANCGGCGSDDDGKDSSNIAVLNCLQDQVILSSTVCDSSQFPVSIQASFYPISRDSLDMGLQADKFIENNNCYSLGRSIDGAHVDSISVYSNQCSTAEVVCNNATSSDDDGCTYYPPKYDTSYSFNSNNNPSCKEIEECKMVDSTYSTYPCDTCDAERHTISVSRCEWVVPDACGDAKQSCVSQHNLIDGCTISIDTADGYSSFSRYSNSSCNKETAATSRKNLLTECENNIKTRAMIFDKLKDIGKQTFTYMLYGCEDLENSFSIGEIAVPTMCQSVEKEFDQALMEDHNMDVVDERMMNIIECTDTVVNIGQQVTGFDANDKPIVNNNMIITHKFTKNQYVDSVKIELSANLGEAGSANACTQEQLVYWSSDSNAYLFAKDHPFEYSCNLWNNVPLGTLFRDSVLCDQSPPNTEELYCGCYTPVPTEDTSPIDASVDTARCKLVDSWDVFEQAPLVSEYGAAQDSGFSGDANAYYIMCSDYGDSIPSAISLTSTIDTLHNIPLTKLGEQWKSAPLILSWNVVDKALAPSRILRVLPAGGSWGLPVGLKLSTPDGVYDYNVCRAIQKVPLRFHYTKNTGYCEISDWHSASDSLLKMANALWSQECIQFTLEASDSVMADFSTDGAAELVVQCDVKLLNTPSEPEGCQYDVFYGGRYDFKNLPKGVAYGGDAYFALVDSFATKFSQDKRVIDIVYLDAVLTMFTENSTVTAAGFALPQKANMYEPADLKTAFGKFADSISAPIVFLGCNDMYSSFNTVLAHELGHIVTGRDHVTEPTSIMHAHDKSIAFWPGYEMIGLGHGTISEFLQYQKSPIRTHALKYGATGTFHFTGDY